MAPTKAHAVAKASRTRATTRRPSGRTTDRSSDGGDVQRWIAAVKPDHAPIVKKVDALIRKTVPGVRTAVKWRQAFYGVEGKGWIVAMNSYTHYVSLTFFAGTRLKPVPPLGEHKFGRRANIHGASELDETRLRSWFRQAASIKGWGTVR